VAQDTAIEASQRSRVLPSLWHNLSRRLAVSRLSIHDDDVDGDGGGDEGWRD
jgi:hypothetical protein